MRFPQPLIEGRLVRRYKRFLADVELSDGDRLTIHCPNTGSMLGCDVPGSRVWFSRSDNTKRKYPHTWELVEVEAGTLVGINTGRSNALVREALEGDGVPELAGYEHIRGEVRFGAERSRVDLLLSGTERDCYVEVKNVTLCVDAGVGLFPDAVTARGTKHLRELTGVASDGGRAVIFFCVQRADVRVVRPADNIDPEYGRTLREALRAGVEALAYGARVSPEAVELTARLPVALD